MEKWNDEQRISHGRVFKLIQIWSTDLISFKALMQSRRSTEDEAKYENINDRESCSVEEL